MTSRILTRNSAIADIEEPPAALDSPQVTGIADELNSIVGKSRRHSGLHRALRSVGRTFAKWLDGMVPPAAAERSSDPPPQIRFPFF